MIPCPYAPHRTLSPSNITLSPSQHIPSLRILSLYHNTLHSSRNQWSNDWYGLVLFLTSLLKLICILLCWRGVGDNIWKFNQGSHPSTTRRKLAHHTPSSSLSRMIQSFPETPRTSCVWKVAISIVLFYNIAFFCWRHFWHSHRDNDVMFICDIIEFFAQYILDIKFVLLKTFATS